MQHGQGRRGPSSWARGPEGESRETNQPSCQHRPTQGGGRTRAQGQDREERGGAGGPVRGLGKSIKHLGLSHPLPEPDELDSRARPAFALISVRAVCPWQVLHLPGPRFPLLERVGEGYRTPNSGCGQKGGRVWLRAKTVEPDCLGLNPSSSLTGSVTLGRLLNFSCFRCIFHMGSKSYLIGLLKAVSRDFPGGSVVMNLPASAGNTGSSPGPGRSHMPRSN